MSDTNEIGGQQEVSPEQVEQQLAPPVPGEAVTYFGVSGCAQAAVITAVRGPQGSVEGVVRLVVFKPGDSGTPFGKQFYANNFEYFSDVPHSSDPQPGHWSRIREVKEAWAARRGRSW